MNTMTIGIIGSGLSSLSFVNSLTKNLQFNKTKLEIIVFDDKESFGRGMAYSIDSESNILNTKARYLTYDSSKKGDFYHWLTENKDQIQREYKLDLNEINKDSFLPRSIFGKYLVSKWNELFELSSKNLKIHPYFNKANHIKPHDNNNYNYLVETENGFSFKVHNVILATGTSNRCFDKYNNNSNFITTPYKTNCLPFRIKKNEKVLIMGSRLSAIDSIIALKEAGHQGQIYMHCIAGTFPTVRGQQQTYTNKYLCKDYISKNFQNVLTTQDIINLYHKELGAYFEQNAFEFEDIIEIYNKFPIVNLQEFIKNELIASKKDRPWQAILYDTNRSLSKVWNKLSKSDKKNFLHNHFNKFMGIRVSIPRKNAEKILNYLSDGGLTYTSGQYELEENKSAITFKAESINKPIQIDKVVFCTGSPANLAESDSLLIKKLIKQNLISNNEFGGIEVTENYNVINANCDVNQNIFALGELIRGKFLFVSAIDLIYSHGERCGKIFATRFLNEKNGLQPTVIINN
ncbi:FAD/NAD(P)-binding protein [Xenorhabdus doucetiae]|uniref:NAD(P)/FAD-binding protein YdhS n=1 Tax=Xenorhabdus doucetiae TaxID=351671 RepID=A0A068QPK1_9GAMM|nr:FAD/NAD(P)-binding protein [Xenorhabdus doucetiae]TYP16428.1 putative NAD(P)/FAD-binding protein YdhS [Xenorhabdus doucetiae]CDG16918.1 exported protein of unknown function [Xenorhabdus doucetiae]